MIHSFYRKGFTLIELSVAVGIVAILAAVAFLAYDHYVDRARGTDVVEKYGAIRTKVAVSQQSGASVEDCAELASRFGSANLGDPYVSLSYGFEAVSGGFRPVLHVCANRGQHGVEGVKVARGAYETLIHDGVVEDRPLLTESLVSYALRLTDGNQAACRTYQPNTSSPCAGAVTSVPAAALSPAVATQPAQTLSPAVDTQPAQALTPAPTQPAQEPAPAQTPADAAVDEMLKPQNQAATDALIAALASVPKDQPISALGPNAGQAEKCGFTPDPTVTADTFLGDCTVDFNGMCDMCFVAEYCQVTCQISAPMTPAQRAQVEAHLKNALRPLCEAPASLVPSGVRGRCEPFWASGEFRKY